MQGVVGCREEHGDLPTKEVIGVGLNKKGTTALPYTISINHSPPHRASTTLLKVNSKTVPSHYCIYKRLPTEKAESCFVLKMQQHPTPHQQGAHQVKVHRPPITSNAYNTFHPSPTTGCIRQAPYFV